MILFNCQECGRKFQVKDEFAGRSTECPGCQQPLVVPDPGRTEAYVPKDRIDGTPSSLDQTGTDAGVSLPGPSRPDQKSIPAVIAERDKSAGRYVLQGEIARGGMGAVLRGIDCDLRREVAIKFMLNDKDGRQKTRFIEEAQITGQLEHPNIVPIHELGVDAQKRLFFTMKMVKGRSLAQILDELAKNPTAASEWSLGRLLNIVVSICHALGYAHSRNVIHRDLKPANVMVGDFGEVYVMDWGLAKVLGSEAPSRKTSPDAIAARPLLPHATGGSVSTNRETEGDLTQAGSILGTPAYMPPEQAHGKIDAIDQRSDIYSLGAILYAVLTLLPPVEKGGNQMAVLMRVGEGDIKKPEVRTPQRYIPAEVSAIAMKALAKSPADRYQTVEAFRRDVELFVEGRSVSAKQDTVREQVWKLVKRNKGASLATAAALLVLTVVLAVAFWINIAARIQAETANTNFLKAQEEKRLQAKSSAPAFLRAAREMAGNKKFDDALLQVNTALENDPEQAEGYLLRGQLLLGLEKFAEAVAPLNEYQRRAPKDAQAKKLADLVGQAKPEDLAWLLAVAEVLQEQKAFRPSEKMTQLAERFVKSQKELLTVYQKRIDAAWPGQGMYLNLDAKGKMHFSLQFSPLAKEIRNLEPLNGMPLTSLNLYGCRILQDLGAVKGMPLTELNLYFCEQLRDLKPLQELKLLAYLNLSTCREIKDLDPLQKLPLATLNLEGCALVDDLSPLKGMKLTSLGLTSCANIRDLSVLHGMPLVNLDLTHCRQIRDLSFVQGMKLISLSLAATDVHNLAILQGMPLTELNLGIGTPVFDLSPLQGMPLASLGFPRHPRCTDLRVLHDLPLTTLNLYACTQVQDLTPLGEMKLLTSLNLRDCDQIQDLKALQGLKLTRLFLWNCKQIRDLAPLKGMPLNRLEFHGTQVQDLSPLEGMDLSTVALTPQNITKGMDKLRAMPRLNTIQVPRPMSGDLFDTFTHAEFFRKFDAGDFKK